MLSQKKIQFKEKYFNRFSPWWEIALLFWKFKSDHFSSFFSLKYIIVISPIFHSNCNHLHILLVSSLFFVCQSAGAVEYTDCFSEEG